MDRLKDRLAALAEEVGELAQPPGAAVTVWRARRRRRRVVAKVAGMGLLSVVVGGLLLNPLGRGLPDATPRPWAFPVGPPTISLVGHVVAAGEQMTIVGEGCFPGEPGTVSLPRMGIRKSVPIRGDGSFITQVVVPRSTKPGTYDIVLRCHFSPHMGQAIQQGQVVQHVVIRSVRGHPGASR
jgi:hypothetical protein